jgi:thioredoxin reductase
MWDTEVDVACIGAGLGALASAIATADAGGEVLVAAPQGERGASHTGFFVAWRAPILMWRRTSTSPP